MQASAPAAIAPAQVLDVVAQTTGLADREIAQALNTTPRTLMRWRRGDCYPQHSAREQLALLAQVAEHLRYVFRTDDAARRWIAHPNRYLRGTTPANAIATGHPERVEAALVVIDAGIFT